jgi:hypothetical protein
MVDVKYPKENWTVIIKLNNVRCPFIYYPAEYIGCLIREENRLENNECQKENCPFKVGE